MIDKKIAYICKNFNEYFFIKNYYLKKGYSLIDSDIPFLNFFKVVENSTYVNVFVIDELKQIRYYHQPSKTTIYIDAKNIIRKFKLEKISK